MKAASALAAFIPIDRRIALAQGRSLPEVSCGTALFADISGFTPLTGKLMQKLGPKRGAEEVLHILNPVFEGLIAQLHRFGGTVIGFAGDSITCWLAEDQGLRAIACAMAMQETMIPYGDMRAVAGTHFSIQLKIAITYGPARRFVVGLSDIGLMDVLAGKTLQRMAAAEKMANSGETLVETAILHRLGGVVQVKEWRTGKKDLVVGLVTGLNDSVTPSPWPELPAAALSDEQVRPWLHRPVFDRLNAGQAYLAELRPASALFLRFSGLDYDGDEDSSEKLDEYIKWVQEVIDRYHGYLIQLTFGDKGSFLYVAFGAPITHGINPLLASAAALDLQSGSSAFEGINNVQIGISTGRMWTGAYGGNNRRTYGVMGNETNMAARLMSKAAPSEILVTRQVYEESKAHFTFHRLGPLEIKGSDKPLPVWEITGPVKCVNGSLDLSKSPLIGRNEPLALMNRLLDYTLEGRGQVISLLGHAGIGKSHLVANFCRQTIEKGLEPIIGTCESITQGTAYYPWNAIFRALLDLDSESQKDSVTQLFTSLIPLNSDWLIRLPLLGDLLSMPIPNNATTDAMDAGMRQKALFSLALEIIQAKAQKQPIVLIIENVQWMDEVSEALLEALSRQIVGRSSILVLLTYRPPSGSQPSLLQALDELAYKTEIRLSGLPADKLQELIQLNLRGRPSRLLVSFMKKMTQGNPFLVEELSEAMRRAGQMAQREDGTWQVSDDLLSKLQAAGFVIREEGFWNLKGDVDLLAVQLGIPDSIHDITLLRLDRLPEAHKLTLKVGSAIGHRIDLRLLAQVHPEGKTMAQILGEVELLEKEGIVHHGSLTANIIAFRHHTTQEVIYDTLLHSQRQHLHQLVAEALDAGQPEAVTQIAQHAFSGCSWSLALKYCLLAGQKAQNLHANQQAIDFFQKALESVGKLADTDLASEGTIIHLALGELLVSTGDYDSGDEHLIRALDLAKELKDGNRQACASRWLGRSFELRGEYEEALSWLEGGVVALDGLDSSEEAELSLIAGLIHIRQGNYDDADWLCQQSLHLAHKLGDVSVQAKTYNLMGIVDRRRGNNASAIGHFRKALVIYNQITNVYGQATSHNLIATSQVTQGDWKQADHHYRQSLDLFIQLGDIYNQVLVNSNLGSIALRQGRLDDAVAYYQRAIVSLERIGRSLWVNGALHMNMANAHIQLGNLEEAQNYLRLAQDFFERAKIRDLLPELVGLYAEAALRKGNLEEAEAFARRSVALAQELKMRKEEGHNLRILGEITHAKEQYSTAKQMFEKSNAILSEVNDIFEMAKTQFSLAQLERGIGELEAANRRLDGCNKIFSRLEAELEMRCVEETQKLITYKTSGLSTADSA